MFDDDNGFFYIFKGHKFAYTADKLEKIADLGDETWLSECKKIKKNPGEFTKFDKTFEMHIAENDRRCREISIYLFAHSIECFLKGIYLNNTGKKLYEHKITKIFDKTKTYLSNIKELFDSDNLNELFQKLDEVLIWAGRYPAPKNKTEKHKEDAHKCKKRLGCVKYENQYIGYTDDFCISINSIANSKGIELMKNFVFYITDIARNKQN